MIASNRGPLSFTIADDGQLVAKRGAGGLVSGLAPLAAETGALWLACALSDGDRRAAHAGVTESEGLRVQLVDIDASVHRMAYDVICNATLWFALHGLFDLPRRPRIDAHWREAWDAYRAMNNAFADTIAATAPEHAVVLVQDYHLALVGPRLCAQRDDIRTTWFGHTPFCWPDGLRPIPDDAASAFVAGIAGHHACGFHSTRWVEAFTACARQREIAASPFIAPLGADPDDLARVVESSACQESVAALEEQVGDRRLLVRVDRIELSKNVLRGFHAFDELLTRHPEWRERVAFAAFLYPSREGLPEYLSYRQEVEGLARLLNDKWATPTWTPILFDADDDFPRSVAALRRADVLLVNPIRDGLNLVAKEGVLVSERHCALVLSTEAGVWDELGAAGAIGINPFDVGATATALHDALSMPDDERAERHTRLRAAAQARTSRDWLTDQLAAATR